MLHTLLHIYSFFVTDPNAQCAIAPLLLGAIIGAATGVANNRAKQEQADEERQYEARTARYAPWTHLQSHFVANPNLTQDVIGGAAGGAALGQGIGNANAYNDSLQKPGPDASQPLSEGGMSGIGPYASGNSYANALDQNNVGPYAQGSLYAKMLQAFKAPRVYANSNNSDSTEI